MTLVLNDVCEFIVDCPHSTAPDEGRGYPIIRTPNVGRGYLILDGVQRVSENAYNQRNIRAVPQNGDLILAREAPAGNVAIIDTEEKVCLGQRTVLLRPDAAKVDPWFLNYYLNAPDQRHALLKNANGATVGHVNMPIIRNLPINLPNPTMQVRISGILRNYDRLIENNRKQIKLLEEAAQRLYKEWFIDYKFPGHDLTSIDSDTKLPEGWKLEDLLSQISFIRGRSYGSENLTDRWGLKLINLNNVAPYGGWSSGAEKGYDGKYSKEQTVQEGDVILAVTDMTKERRLVGHAARIPRGLNGSVISMDLIKLNPHEMPKEYLYCYLRFSGVAEMIAMLANGTNVLHLKPDELDRVPSVIPSLELQTLYAEKVKPQLEAIDTLEERISKLQEARDRLLPKLMSGEIEVS